jgi:hypothetical protein
VSVDRLYIADDGDSDPGDLYLWASVAERSRAQIVDATVNIYPFPNGYWREVRDGTTVELNLPIYLRLWDNTPEELKLKLVVMDNDEGPAWIPDAVKGLSDILNYAAQIAKDLADLPAKLPRELVVKLTGDRVFTPLMFGALWGRVLESWERYQAIAPGVQSDAAYARVAAELLKIIGQNMGDAPDPIGMATEIICPGELRPERSNNWGIPQGQSSVTCWAYDVWSPPSDVQAARRRLAQITLRKVPDVRGPVSVSVILHTLRVRDNRDDELLWGDPEIWISTRVVDMPDRFSNLASADLTRLMNGLDPRLRDLLGGSDLFFLGQRQRLPDQEFYETNDNSTQAIGRRIFRTAAIGPMLYVEVEVNEDDAEIVEDKCDWLGSLSLLFTADDLLRLKGAPARKWYRLSEYADVELEIIVE